MSYYTKLMKFLRKSVLFFRKLSPISIRIPFFVLLITPLIAFVCGLFLFQYIEKSTRRYSSEPIKTPMSFFDSIRYVPEVIDNAEGGYSLPLSRLPENYNEAVSFSGIGFSRHQMILILRDGFVVSPREYETSISDLYQELAQFNIPLSITSDAVLVWIESVHQSALSNAQENFDRSASDFWQEVGKELEKRSLTLNPTLHEAYRKAFREMETATRNNNQENNTQPLDTSEHCRTEPFIFNRESSLSTSTLIVTASILKDERLQTFQQLALFDSFFEIGCNYALWYDVDEAIKTCDGFGKSDTALLEHSFIDCIQNELETNSHAEINQETNTDDEILVQASQLRIRKACELSGNDMEPCLSLSMDPPEFETNNSIKWWSMQSIVEASGSGGFDYKKSPDWEKKSSSTALWTLLSKPQSELSRETENEFTSDDLELPSSYDVTLEPQGELYNRVKIQNDVFGKIMSETNLLDAESTQHLENLSIYLSQLVIFSRKLLTNEEMSQEERGKMVEIVNELITDTSYSSLPITTPVTNRVLWVARSNGDGTYILSAGPYFGFELIDESQREIFKEEDQTAIENWLSVEVIDNNFDEAYDRTVTAQGRGTVRIPVLMYHQITPSPTSSLTRRLYIAPEVFEQQLAYLAAKNYRTVTPEQFYELLASGQNPPQKTVMLTFDDSVSNHYTNAFPLLKKYGFVGVFYVVSHRSGITALQMKEMADAGMIIDSHSKTHKDLTKIDDELLYQEIVGSKASLEGATGKRIISLCYPGCVVDSRGIQIAASSGYLLGFSCGKAIDHVYTNRFVLSRIHVYDDMDNFMKIMSGIWEIPASYYQ